MAQGYHKIEIGKKLSYSDNIWQGHINGFRFKEDNDPGEFNIASRVPFFTILLFLILLIFFARIFMMTVINGASFRALADTNRVQLIELEAQRGKLLDRNGSILAQSHDEYVLMKDTTRTTIAESQVRELEAKGLAGENYEGELGKITKQITRLYPLGVATSHVLGYISKPTEVELKNNSTLSMIDSVGRIGIEQTYDMFIRGKNGRRLVEVDSVGKKVSLVDEDPPRTGRDIVLTLDSELTRVSFEVLSKHLKEKNLQRGALIIQNPNTGEVLSLISFPSFDPLNVGASVADKNNALFNRVTQGTYPPGSVFKIVTALAGLESNSVTKDTEIDDVGEFYVGDIRFSNWYYTQYGGRDGMVKVDRAIARSNDTYFYKIAEKTGLSGIRATALKFGFGQKTGIDLGDESFGLVPDDVWKRSTVGEPWYPGDTMHLGIGQGFMLVTPIQVNMMTSYMASGVLAKPYVVSKITSEVSGSRVLGKPKENAKEVRVEPKVLGRDLASQVNFAIVREGMRQACAAGGTAWPFFEASYRVGCKTGTAEKGVGNPHAWFTAFAPFDDSKLAITVLVEDGGEGSSVAAPIAKEILDWWFKNRSS